jgi:hypothetical protein
MSLSSETAAHGHFCPACGAEIDASARFCPLCGLSMTITGGIQPQSSLHSEEPAAIPVEKVPQESKMVKYADGGERFLAFLIDSAIISLIMRTFLGLLGLAGVGNISFWNTHGIDWVFSIIYFIILDYRGQTIGKMLLKLRVVDDRTFGPITRKQAFLHVIGKVFFGPLDVIVAHFINDEELHTQGKVRATQRLSKTVVIKVN